VAPVDRTMRKSRRFTMCLPGTIKAACEHKVDSGFAHGADRMGKKERRRKWTGCLDEMYWGRGYEMQKWENENWSLIGRTANLTVAGRGVVGGEWDKMSDQKMQEKKVHRKDVSEEQLKVMRCIGHETLKCKSD
jgi:hypothetical protein